MTVRLAKEEGRRGWSDPWTDLGLTLPVFLAYHLGVAFLPVRNAADPLTHELRALANQSLPLYAGLTMAIGVAMVIVLVTLGRGQALCKSRLLLVALEGTVYAVAMRVAGAYAVGSLRLGPPGAVDGTFAAIVLSLGAGFYEELAFRVGVFGVGAVLLKGLFGDGFRRTAWTAGWAVVAAAAFSTWHYVGAMGDAIDAPSFVFRAVCGLVLTLIFAFRGFAAAVWTHALYDVWVLVLG